MEPLKGSQSSPSLPNTGQTQKGASYQGRIYSLSLHKPHEDLFLKQFAKMLYDNQSKPIGFKGKVLSEGQIKDPSSPLTSEDKSVDYRKLKTDQVAEKGELIKHLLEKFQKGFPEEKDFAQLMLHTFLESATEQEFIQNTRALINIPKEETLKNLFIYCAQNRELMDELKNEYQDYQKNYQSTLKIAFKLHEEFLKIYLHEGPAFDSANGIVVLSQNQLEFAKSLAKKYFPQILELGWTPQLELKNASLIQAIVVGDNMVNKADNTLFLPKSPACFSLKETFGKVLPGTPKDLKPGISFSFNHFVNFKNTTGIDVPTSTDTKYTKEELLDLFKSVMQAFTNDSIKRSGMDLITGTNKTALGTPLGERPLLATVLYIQFIEHLQNNPNEYPKMIREMLNSPLLKSVKEAFPEYFSDASLLGQTVFPRDIFLKLLQTEIDKNHTEHMSPLQIRFEKELLALQMMTEITPVSLKEINLKADDAIEERRLLPDLQSLIQFKFLEVFMLINQSTFAPMIAPLSAQLFSETTPFFPNPINKEYVFRNGLNSFTASLTCDIVTPSQEGNPNAVYDRFSYKPVVGQLKIVTQVPNISALEHSPENQPVSNSLKDLLVSWKAPKSVVQTLISKVVPEAKPVEISSAEELLKNDLFKQLELLSQIKPGDDLIIDDTSIKIYHMNVNKVRPYTNFVLGKLPTKVSGTITYYSGYSNENQYNPKAEEQLTHFTEKLDKAIKLYVEQAIAQGKDYSEINEFITDQVSTRLAKVHIALKNWGLVDQLISPKGKYYQMANEIASFYLVPTNISD